MSLLREIIRLRDESARSHPATSYGHKGAVSVLHANVHQEQHREAAYRAGAQRSAQAEGQSFGLGLRAAVTTSSASLSPSPARSSSARDGTGGGHSVSGDHHPLELIAMPSRGYRASGTREERLQYRYLRFPFVVVSVCRPGFLVARTISSCACGKKKENVVERYVAVYYVIHIYVRGENNPEEIYRGTKKEEEEEEERARDAHGSAKPRTHARENAANHKTSQ